MEQLAEKCRILRNMSSSNGKYEENDIYVILSTLSLEDTARSPCSTLLITAIEKLRLSAGISRSSEEPNLILVPHFNDVPVTSAYYIHWNNPVFCERTAVKIESVIEIFDNRRRNLNPFRRIDNSKLLTLFGPRQEIINLKNEGHEIHHDAMKTAIESILISTTPKFSDFHWLVHAAIRSQNCEHCLFYLLNPLSSVQKVQKLVRTLTRGVWSPRADMDMELTPEWVGDDGKKLALGCWRLDPDAKFPTPQEASPTSSELQCLPSEFEKTRQPLHLETLKSVMLALDEKIQALIDCDKKEEQLKELKSQRIRIGNIFVELQGTQIEMREFGFKTGNSALDRGLEIAVTKMLNNSDSEFNPAGIIRSMDFNTFKLYCEVENASLIETEIVDKITDKLKRLMKISNITPTAPEYPNGNSEKERETSVPDILEELDEQEGDAEVVDVSDPTASPKPKRAKIDEVKLEDKLKDIKSAEQKELLVEAYSEAILMINEMNPSDLPITRADNSDEFCVFCGEFIYDPLPDLSCGFHDDYQQIVNLDIKEMLIRRKCGRSITEKTVNIMKQYLIQQNDNWQKAIEKNTIPMPPKSRSVSDKPKEKTVTKSASKTKQKVPKIRTRKTSSSSEDDYRNIEEYRIKETFSELPPNFGELMEEPCCSSRRVSVMMTVSDFAEYRSLKPPPPPVLSDGQPRSTLVVNDPFRWVRDLDKPKQKAKRQWPKLGKRKRKKPAKKVENQPENEVEEEERDVTEIVANLGKETIPTTSRVHHFHDSHEEDEVRMEDVLED